MKTLKALSQKAATLCGIQNVLGWDQETFMPPGAAEARADQMQLLAGIIHDAKTNPEYEKALNDLIDIKTGKIKLKKASEEDQAALREWRRDFLIETSLPKSFVEEFSKLTSTSIEAWKEARKENSFKKFAPFLEKIIAMSRKKAELLGYKDSPYDALLDIYEPGLTSKQVEKTFDEVQKALTPLIKKAKSKKKPYKKKMGEKEQLAISHVVLERMGYDLALGRIDLSTHPFSSAPHPTDSRITTRLSLDNPLSNILTTLHEAGHAVYELGLPLEHYGTPLCESISLGIHESQSRFWETRIGLSMPFWQSMEKTLNEPAQKLYDAVNQVSPSFIRVEADEATYPLHVILRFRLEKRLIEGTLKVKDIPEAWRKEMKDLLGIEPPTDTEGCLQDIHWSMGGFGYFPTYLLGTLYASQFFETFAKAHPDWEKKVKKGELLFIRKWLGDNIHKHGRRYRPLELLEKVTGKPFSPQPFLSYLSQKLSK